MKFDIVDVSDWVVAYQESEGADPKEWISPRTNFDDLWLYKPSKTGIETGYRRYDDVAERLASALAEEIGLPAAKVEFASRDGIDGIISRNVRLPGWELHSGNVRLSECPEYVSCAEDVRLKNRIGHNLSNIESVLSNCAAPQGLSDEHSGFSVFAGYLVFDAWIANTDRHAINWAVLDRGGEQRLAPSFDHGTALGSGIRESDLSGKDSAKFARSGMATRFENGRKRTLVDLALDAVEVGGAPARMWLERIVSYDQARLDVLLAGAANTMRLSEERRIFIKEILQENQRRLRT